MKKKWAVALIVIAVVCFIGALYYLVRYVWYRYVNESQLDDLREIRRAAVQEAANAALPSSAGGEDTLATGLTADGRGENASAVGLPTGAREESAPAADQPAEAQSAGDAADVSPSTDKSESLATDADERASQGMPADGSDAKATEAQSHETEAVNAPSQADDARFQQTDAASQAELDDNGLEALEAGPVSYFEKAHVSLDPSRILPQYARLYALNKDLVGWLLIDELGVDYPVMQTPGNNNYYLHRDFRRRYNFNGQLILDETCDPYTPSYNLIIYGHNMRNGTMFGELQYYRSPDFWRKHKLIEFDSLMQERQYVVVACFLSEEYRKGQSGFRYALDFRDEGEYQAWIDQVRARQLYDTGIDCAFGDEFLTLSTCSYHVKNGRLVVVARRLREGEIYEREAS